MLSIWELWHYELADSPIVHVHEAGALQIPTLALAKIYKALCTQKTPPSEP